MSLNRTQFTLRFAQMNKLTLRLGQENLEYKSPCKILQLDLKVVQDDENDELAEILVEDLGNPFLA